jgi:hypothetical protein
MGEQNDDIVEDDPACLADPKRPEPARPGRSVPHFAGATR